MRTKTWATGERRASTMLEAPAVSERSGSAFTLIEVLVVVAIIGVLSLATTAIMIRPLHRARVREEARRLAATARLARATAVAECRRVRLEYNLDEHAYCLTIERRPVEMPGVFEEYARSEGAPHELGKGIRFLSVQTELGQADKEGVVYTTFFRSGAAEKTVIYLGDEDKTHTIVIRGSTGLVKTFDFEKEEITHDDLDLDEMDT